MFESISGKKTHTLRPITLSVAFVLCFLCIDDAIALDKDRYISIDEVRTDMEAYCLTVLQGRKIERFSLKILSIVRNHEPKRDAILVVGTDERFIHGGTIHGNSGSPVYIDGRLAGALAAGWDGSKDPLYLVTPIEDMLTIGSAGVGSNAESMGIDFSRQIDLMGISEQLNSPEGSVKFNSSDSQLPLVTSLPQSVCDELSGRLAAFGLVPLAGGGSTQESLPPVEYKPGGVLAISLVSGDISMAAIGTITEVIDGKVYGFGHHFTSIGPVDLPMAGGMVHTVIPGILRASKFATPTAIKGAIRFDESTGIIGLIDSEAKTIPLHIKVRRFNDPQEQTYNCLLAVNRLRTPMMLQSAIVAAISMRGDLPPEHTLRYTGSVEVAGYDPIRFNNISSGDSYSEVAGEALSVVALLMGNPYGEVDIKSLNFEIDITPDNKRSVIRTVNLSNTLVKPGQTINASVLLQSYMSELSLHELKIDIPADLAEGDYEITIGGGYDYEKFLRKVAPYRFMAYDVDTLVETLAGLVSIKRDRLYITMSLPEGGVVIKRAELPDLPPTKAILLSDTKRTITAQRYRHWIEKDIPVDRVVIGGKIIKIKVEK